MKQLVVAIGVGAFCIVSLAQQVSFAQQRENDVDDKAAAREEWFYSQREYPLGQIPAGARLKAIADIQNIQRTIRARRQTASAAGNASGASLAATMDAANWTSIGPRPTDAGSTYVTAGRVNAVAVDPRDNNTVYIGAAEGGVWKTTDGGVSWTPLTDDQASLASGAIAIDPAHPDTVYVGTGEENFAQDSYYGAGILKSTDAGHTWTNIVGPFLKATIGALAISPAGSNVLLCSSNRGIYRSSDGAATWTSVLAGTGTSVLFDPTNGSIAYAALGNVNGNAINGVYRSTDGGQTWTLLTGSGANALPSANVGRIEIAISPSTPTTLYAGIQDSSTATFGDLLGIYKSTDSGATWNNLSAPDICAGVAQCWYDMSIRVHPTNPDIVFAAGSLSIMRTMDGGATWNQLSFIGPNQVQIHVDEHYLAFTPDGSKLYIGNDGGVYSTTDVTNPVVSWTELNDTLAITQFYPGLSINPTNASIAFAGAQDNGTQRYGGSASWDYVTCGDGGFTAIDGALPAVAYAACDSIQNQFIPIRRTANGGNTWASNNYGINLKDRVQFIPPLAIDPSDPETLYFGTYRVWQTRDGAGKWVAISPDLTKGSSASIKTISIAPGDPNTVYAGTSDSKVQITTNALDGTGASWTDRSAGLPGRAVTQIVVDPIDPATAYVAFSGFMPNSQGHVFKTTDSGADWTDISGNLPNLLPVNNLVVDPDIPDTLYIGTDAGVMVTTDGGATWTTLGNGLPLVVVDSLVLHRASRTLRAATHGRSMWDILVPLPSPSLQPIINSILPNTVNAGGAGFSISVSGANFTAGTVLRWNGSSRPTNVVGSTNLTAQISAADIALVGRIVIDVMNPSPGAAGSNSLNFTIGPAPATSSQAFVNSANPTGGDLLAPGSLASLYGTNLAGATVVADAAPPWPLRLGGTSMTIGGANVPLFFVSSGQINFQVPYFNNTGPVPTNLTITEGTLSTTITVSVTPYAPGLYTINAQGTGQASAIIAGASTIAAPSGAFPGSRPAQKGEFVSLYCTGLGAVTHRPALGAPSPSNPLATTAATPTVTVGGVNASVTFSGLAPGYVGLYQVNIQVPATAPSGPAVPVILSIGGVTANTVTLAVQ
jgi:uncharacterized protein (TIGR03437 family)